MGEWEDWQKLSSNVYAKLVAQAWADDAFRERLLANPREVFAEHGFSLPEDLEVKVVPGTKAATWTLPLPERPADLSAQTLEEILSVANTFLAHC